MDSPEYSYASVTGYFAAAQAALYTLTDTNGYNATIHWHANHYRKLPEQIELFEDVALAPASGPPNQAIVPTCPASLTLPKAPLRQRVSAPPIPTAQSRARRSRVRRFRHYSRRFHTRRRCWRNCKRDVECGEHHRRRNP